METNENKQYYAQHLDFIERTIERLSGKCTNTKEWSAGLMVGLVGLTSIAGLYKGNYGWLLFITSITISLLFAFFDTYYLFLERKYRVLYDIVRAELLSGSNKWHLFDMSTSLNNQFYKDAIVNYNNGRSFWKRISPEHSFITFLKCFCSLSIWPFYFILSLMAFLVFAFPCIWPAILQ